PPLRPRPNPNPAARGGPGPADADPAPPSRRAGGAGTGRRGPRHHRIQEEPGEEAMTPTCINLRERFGSIYRIGRDESAEQRKDPWTLRLLCRRGVIYPWGGDRLGVMIDHRPGVARRVGALPGVVMEQGGDREFTFSFDVALFEQVAAIVQ